MILQKFFYGEKEDQFINIYGKGEGPWIFLIHGGYWKQKYTEKLNNLMVSNFLKHNFKILSVEYRRGKSKWPTPLKDVENGIKAFKKSPIFKGEDIIFIGHSVGGQIGIMLHEYSDFTIVLAPVTDVTYTYKEKLGEGVVSTYFNIISKDFLTQASPINMSCLGQAPLLLMHGKNDRDVHHENSQRFYEKFSEKKENINFLSIEMLDHMDCIKNEDLLNQISKIIINYSCEKEN